MLNDHPEGEASTQTQSLRREHLRSPDPAEGRLRHPSVPLPVEKITLSVYIVGAW